MEIKTKGISLKFIWGIRLKLRAEGDKLYAEGSKLWAEGDKLYAEGDKLYAEGGKLWAEAIIEAYGNITLKWESGKCILETGEIFEENLWPA